MVKISGCLSKQPFSRDSFLVLSIGDPSWVEALRFRQSVENLKPYAPNSMALW